MPKKGNEVTSDVTQWHRRFVASVRWRLTPAGLEVEGSGVERTPGEPKTVTRVWETFGQAINAAAQRHQVPAALIVATICTESGGRTDAVRQEPGWTSDQTTPHRVSVGLMQTLISTARAAAKDPGLDRRRLLDPATSINAGTAFIAQQRPATLLDPPVVAAAYNAGGVYEQHGAGNRWKMRQYPIGSGKHCDRFVRWFNDAVFVLDNHPLRPAVLQALNGPSQQQTPPPWSHTVSPHAGVIQERHRDCEAVRRWQQRMVERGWSLKVDGDFGPKSRDALLQLQRQAFPASTDHDGRLGPRSWQKSFS